MPTTGVLYLGRVIRVPRPRDTYYYATVQPLIQSNADGSEWVGPLRDAGKDFPKAGRVHWHDAPLDLKEGSVWQFETEEHPSTRGPRSEQFQLKNQRESIEVVDLQGWTDEAALRSAITGEGIALSPQPLGRRVMLLLPTGLCAGPVLLKPGAEPGVWALDESETRPDPARVPVYRPRAATISRVSLDGVRLFVSPPLDFGQPAGIQNWMSDMHVARTILGRLRKMDAEVVKGLGLTENLFREYLEHVERGRMGAADPAVERARADRLRGVRNSIQRDAQLLNEAAETLLATAEVRAELESRIRSRVTEEVQKRQEEVDAAVADTSDQLAKVRQELSAKERENASLDAALLTKQRELEAKVASFDEEVRSRLEEIARRPEAFFAESATIRAALVPGLTRHAPRPNGAPPMESHPRDIPSPESASGEPTPELCDDGAIRSALATHAMTAELSIHAMLVLHAVFVAGPTPVVIGERGYDLVRAYADAVAGGRLHWIPTASSTLEPNDVLGRFDSVTGRIIPGPSGLLDVLKDASQSNRLHIIVFDGFNRAPTEAYLLPLLEAARAVRSGDSARTIPIANVRLLADDDPYRELGRLAWPPNVLIAALPSDGSITLPVPRSVWRLLAVLDADDRDRSAIPAPQKQAAPAATEIAPSIWKMQVAGLQPGTAPESSDRIGLLARSFSLSKSDIAAAVGVREVLTRNGLSAEDATAVAASAILIPRCKAEEKAVDEGLRTAGVSVPGWRTIFAEARRLGT